MNEKELRAHAECSLCRRKIGETGSPFFRVLEVRRYAVDLKAMQRQAGLELMTGSVAVAQALSPEREFAKEVYATELTVCERCSLDDPVPVAGLEEFGKEIRTCAE